jgi:hypothetical protein
MERSDVLFYFLNFTFRKSELGFFLLSYFGLKLPEIRSKKNLI